MKSLKTLAIATSLSLGLVLSSQAAKADLWDKRTDMTISTCFHIPGAQYTNGAEYLEAGSYVLKLMNSSSNRHIVQVMDHNNQYLMATVLAIPTYRTEVTDETAFTFSVGQCECATLEKWYYPGDNYGQEFVW
jgi:hypothetical protein